MLSGDELSQWHGIVKRYREFVGERSPVFDPRLVQLNSALSKSTSDDLPDSISEPARELLRAAMPLYRPGQWQEDDRGNRFWMALAKPMLELAGEELAEAHANAYGVPFPNRILVDVSALGWEYGAYTVGQGDSAHAVISSTDPSYAGFAALEMLFHEPSHAIVAPDWGAIGGDLTKVAKELGVTPPPDLWHALLFYTSGELTRRALARRGVRNYEPYILGMYARTFRGFREPLETHWQQYLEGTIGREEAIRLILLKTSAAQAGEQPAQERER